MRDNASLYRVKELHPAIRDEVEEIINEIEKGFPEYIAVRIAQGYRTFEEQDKLYQKGRTTAGPKVTKAKAGTSYHNYGLAIDICILYDKNRDGKYDEVSWDIVKDGDQDGISDWMEIIRAFTKRGYKWGGEFRTFVDYPHLEKSFGYTWKDLLTMHANDRFIAATKYIDLSSSQGANV